jgi:cytochrome c oxidase subunit IV
MNPSLDPRDDRAPGAFAYALVWVLLIVLATLSLLASQVMTGGIALAIALAIAAIKALLVVAVFMHLAFGRPILRVVFAVAISFVLLLVFGVLADIGTRSVASSYVDDRGGPP